MINVRAGFRTNEDHDYDQVAEAENIQRVGSSLSEQVQRRIQHGRTTGRIGLDWITLDEHERGEAGFMVVLEEGN